MKICPYFLLRVVYFLLAPRSILSSLLYVLGGRGSSFILFYVDVHLLERRSFPVDWSRWRSVGRRRPGLFLDSQLCSTGLYVCPTPLKSGSANPPSSFTFNMFLVLGILSASWIQYLISNSSRKKKRN